MQIYNLVRKNTYYDSVTLMLISKQLKNLEGIDDVSVMMGTPANRVILEEANLLAEEGASAGPNDLILAFRTVGELDVAWVCSKIDEQLGKKASAETKSAITVVRTAAKAYKDFPESNLAVISVPGEYAAIEAERALKQGKNVFLFSNNVPVEEEVYLKKLAAEKGLLVMGPDCGTAIINGTGIGFANAVRRGNIGLVSASGTGLQEVTCLLDSFGLGVSHAIGTGGRDLKEEVGALTMLQSLKLLMEDEQTQTIVLISKPPAKSVVDKILDKLTGTTKKVVLCFLGYRFENPPVGIAVAATLEEAAVCAALINGKQAELFADRDTLQARSEQLRVKLAPGQKYVRALYAGGTLCYESMLILGDMLGPIHSNTPLYKKLLTEDVVVKSQHTAIDLGDDRFTMGRPHPMIDGSLRNEYIAEVAGEKETAVLLLDVVLGYGAGEDPAGDLIPVIEAAQRTACQLGNELVIIGYVCGTERDFQNKESQIDKLTKAGVVVAKTNAEAARLAGMIVSGLGDGVDGSK
jgi:FdrA protein